MSESRTVLTQIAPEAWEHPADRAALNALRRVPGFDEAVKRIFGFFGERGIRLLFQANAVRCGPNQFSRLHALLGETCMTMDWPDQPELYVTQTPIVNASAVGFEHPFIVLNSGAVELLDDDELRVLIGHELGHVISGHALYRTITVLLLELGFQNLPFLAGIALLPIKLALLDWYRKSELSADRAGLLASQDDAASTRLFLKFAGGGTMTDMNLEAFVEQAIKPGAVVLTDGYGGYSGVDELGDACALARWLRTRGLWGGRPTDEDAAAAREVRELAAGFPLYADQPAVR